MHRLSLLALVAGSVFLVGTAAPAERASKPPRSRLTVASARVAPGATVRLAVELVDRTGTPLGAELALGERIQGLALRVRCVPCTGVATLAVEPAGALVLHAPLFEARPTAADGASLLVSYDEIAAPLFGGGRTSGRERTQVATVIVTLDRAVRAGTRIELRLDPSASGLSNQSGTIAETATNGWLELVDGEIVVGRTGKSRG